MTLPLKVPEQLQYIVNGRKSQHSSDIPMTGQTAVITGANCGVGFAAARALAKGGARLILVCRSPDKARKARTQLLADGTADIHLVIADFSKLADVRRAASEVLDLCPSIDVLINNAGVYSTVKTYTADNYETVFAVNHLASFLFTHLLLDRLKTSAPARIIQVNSQGHRFNGLDLNDWNWKQRFYTGLRSYGASKTAQLMSIWEYAEQLEDSGVTINAMHPGSVRSNVGANNGWVYRTFKKYFIDPTLDDPAISAQAIYWLATAPELATVSGRFYNLTIEEKPAKHTLDRTRGKQIFTLSKELTGLVAQ